jgi:hypothetical protein
MVRAMRAWLGVLGVACASLAGCEDSPFEWQPPPETSTTARAPRTSGPTGPPFYDDAGVAIDRSDPVAPAGDLRLDVDSFTSLDACVAEHANLDPVVSDAVRALGYDTLVRDACRVLQALKQKSASPCSDIIASGLERRCLGLVAMAVGDADRCPWIASTDRALGRDPMCVAVATHDPRACGATPISERAKCEALATGQGSHCAKVVGDERKECERELERDRHVLAPQEPDAREMKPPRGSIEIQGQAGTADAAPMRADVTEAVAGGVVVAPTPVPVGGTRLDLTRDRDEGLRLPSRGTERARFVASIVVDMHGAMHVAALQLDAPKMPSVTCPSPHCELKVTIPKLDAHRGAPLAVLVDGTFATPQGTYTLHASIDSFVRDVVTRAAMYSPSR